MAWILPVIVLVVASIYLARRLGTSRVLKVLGLLFLIAFAYHVIQRLWGDRAQLWFSIAVLISASAFYCFVQRKSSGRLRKSDSDKRAGQPRKPSE